MNMRIVLDKKTQKFIADKVSAGEFKSPSDVVRDALTLLRDSDHKKRERLRKAVQAGLDDINKGNFDAVKPSEIGAFVRSLRHKTVPAKAAPKRSATVRK